MSLQAWLAKAAAMGKNLVHGTEELKLGRAAGQETPRMGGLLGEDGLMDKMGEGLSSAKAAMGPGADALEAFLRDHPNLKAAGAGILGAGAGSLLMGGKGDDDDDPRYRRGGMR